MRMHISREISRITLFSLTYMVPPEHLLNLTTLPSMGPGIYFIRSIHTHMHTHMHTHTHTHTHTHKHTHKHPHVHVHTYIHAPTHKHTQTQTHVHIYTYVLASCNFEPGVV